MADDPSVYLRPTKEAVDPTRAFDSKKWLWIPDPEEGFKKACVKSTVGEKVKVELTDGQVSVKTMSWFFIKDLLQEIDIPLNITEQMNPPKFEKIEDMAGLTYLNEASVLHNIRQRYFSSLIYVSYNASPHEHTLCYYEVFVCVGQQYSSFYMYVQH